MQATLGVMDWGSKPHKAIPSSELEVIEHCRHVSPEDQPDKIAEMYFWMQSK